jgi:hypothetical protein
MRTWCYATGRMLGEWTAVEVLYLPTCFPRQTNTKKLKFRFRGKQPRCRDSDQLRCGISTYIPACSSTCSSGKTQLSYVPKNYAPILTSRWQQGPRGSRSRPHCVGQINAPEMNPKLEKARTHSIRSHFCATEAYSSRPPIDYLSHCPSCPLTSW